MGKSPFIRPLVHIHFNDTSQLHLQLHPSSTHQITLLSLLFHLSRNSPIFVYTNYVSCAFLAHSHKNNVWGCCLHHGITAVYPSYCHAAVCCRPGCCCEDVIYQIHYRWLHDWGPSPIYDLLLNLYDDRQQWL